MKKIYESEVKNIGGRTGKSFSSDRSFAVDIAPAKEISGVETTATNPEQLFAAGYAACFHQALQSAFRRNNVQAIHSDVTVFVALNMEPADRSYEISVRIRTSIKGFSQEDAEKYVAQAHSICPYSKAIKGNVDVKLETIVME